MNDLVKQSRPLNPELVQELAYDENGLIPAIIQDFYSGEVLMLAYMNEEALQKTLETKETWFYSRSRQRLWHKGESSGHTQAVQSIALDCDEDTLLVNVIQEGVACHTGERSCFFQPLFMTEEAQTVERQIVDVLYQLIQERRHHPVEGSYTNYLFREGIDKILKKVGEETSEVIIGAKNHDREELIYELSDLIYHSLVLMIEEGVEIGDLKRELTRRHQGR